MPAKCPHCGGDGRKFSWDECPSEDGYGMRYAMLQKNPMGCLISALILVGKKTLATTYRCRMCGRVWRTWFS